jgi:hypothetical protein
VRVTINDVLVGTCDLTGKENVECVRVQLDDGSAELSCRPAELIKLLRLRKRQDALPKSSEKKGPAS